MPGSLFNSLQMEHFKRDMIDVQGQVDTMINSDDNLEEDEISDMRRNMDRLATYRKDLVEWSKVG